MTITEYLNDYFARTGEKKIAFAARADISMAYLTILCRGITNRGQPVTNVSMKVMQGIAAATGVSVGELNDRLTNTPDPAPEFEYKPNSADEDFGDLGPAADKASTLDSVIAAQVRLLSVSQKEKVLAYIQGMLA